MYSAYFDSAGSSRDHSVGVGGCGHGGEGFSGDGFSGSSGGGIGYRELEGLVDLRGGVETQALKALAFHMGAGYANALHLASSLSKECLLRGIVCLDSGASASVFSQRGCFREIEFARRHCEVQGVSGYTSAPWGEVKPNNLRVRRGVFLHTLKLYGLVSLVDLLDAGFDVVHKSGNKGGEKSDPHTGWIFDILTGEEQEVSFQGRIAMTSFEILSMAGAVAKGTDSINMVNINLALTDLQIHQRSGHTFCPPGFPRTQCPECLRAIGARKSALKQRDEQYNMKEPWKSIAGDFHGPYVPESIRGRTINFVLIDDATRFIMIFPLAHKSECVRVLRSALDKVRATFEGSERRKVTFFVRLDNEAVLSSRAIQSIASDYGLTLLRPPPYSPTSNGAIERVMRLLGSYLRLICEFVDPRLHCFASEFLGVCFNLTPRTRYARLGPEFGGLNPIEAVRKLTGGLALQGPKSFSQLRRFGCLAWCTKEPVAELPKLSSKWLRGVYLGPAESSRSHLIGHWVKDGRTGSGFRWGVTTANERYCRFREDILVRDLDMLHAASRGTWTTFDELDQAVLGEAGEPKPSAPLVAEEPKPKAVVEELGPSSSAAGVEDDLDDGVKALDELPVAVEVKKKRGRPPGST